MRNEKRKEQILVTQARFLARTEQILLHAHHTMPTTTYTVMMTGGA